MAPITVRVNTLLQDHKRPSLDSISKYYMIVEYVCGLNRLPILLKSNIYFNVFTLLSGALSFVVTSTVLYGIYNQNWMNPILWCVLSIEYIFCTVFSFASWKRVYLFYEHLSKFDVATGYRPKDTRESMRHFILTAGIVLVFVIHILLDVFVFDEAYKFPILVSVIDAIHFFELSYYGHLMSLVVARLRILHHYMENSLLSGTLIKRPNIKNLHCFNNENTDDCEMKKLMDMYHIIIKAFDLLTNAVTWQMLMIIIATFIRALSFCYSYANKAFHGTSTPTDFHRMLSLGIIQLLPLFSPCVFSGRIQQEVKHLRELIAYLLYENKLDKAGRSSARALLALTEARDLSFSLLRMLRVDVALPFKFIGLLVTYLIILLQFDKVIYPPRTTANSTVT